MMISVAFALAVATSADVMSPGPLHEPDAMSTQVRQGRPLVAWPRAKCWDPNQRVINGICVFDAPPVPPPNTSVLHGGTAFALSTTGRSRGGEQVARRGPEPVLVRPKAKAREFYLFWGAWFDIRDFVLGARHEGPVRFAPAADTVTQTPRLR